MAAIFSRRQFLKLGMLGFGLALPPRSPQFCNPPLPSAAVAIFQAHPVQPLLALTFDDGFVNVAWLLDTCKELGVKLTLFPIGKVIEAKPESRSKRNRPYLPALPGAWVAAGRFNAAA